MKRREAQELIYQRLGDLLAGTDFHFKRNAEGYVRSIPRGRQEIGVAFYDYSPRFEFSIVVTVRLDKVEDITWEFGGTAPEDRSETETVIIRIEYFAPELPSRFEVYSEEHIELAARVLNPIVRGKIIPFLDKHQDVQSLDNALHRSTVPLDTSMHPYRGICGITIAKLAENPDFNLLVEKYLAEMHNLPANDRAKFIRLVDYLKSREEF